VLVAKPDGKRQFGKPRNRWKGYKELEAVWARFVWACSGLSWARYRMLVAHKRLEIYLSSEIQSASREGLCTMDFVLQLLAHCVGI
jgi:hypothetical protein